MRMQQANSYNSKNVQVMDMDMIRRAAPSVFAESPWGKMSDRYRFFPTSEVIQGMLSEGFQCVKAAQANTRIEGKGEFTRHVLRFRHEDAAKHLENVGDMVPELVLMNSHDGTSAYKLMLGIFRKVCANGLVVKSGEIAEISVRHKGHENLAQEVIEGSFQVINEAPKAIELVRDMSNIILLPQEQTAFAKAAIELRGTTLDLDPTQTLKSRRFADNADDAGNRDLWKTFNVVQETLIRGGQRGRGANGQLRRLRAVKSVNEDTKLNRALWTLANEMQAIKQAA